MLIRHCDKCRKELNNETDKDSFVLRGQNIDLCPSCANQILGMIKCSSDNQMSRHIAKPIGAVLIANNHIVKKDSDKAYTEDKPVEENNNTPEDKEETKEEIKEENKETTEENKETTEENKETTEENKETTEEITDGLLMKDINKRVAEIVDAYNKNDEPEKEKREARKAQGKQTKVDKIHEYGIERLAREYLEGKTLESFAEAIGVNKYDMANFIRKNHINRKVFGPRNKTKEED